MAQTSSWPDFMQLLLAHATDCQDVEAFLNQTLTEAQRNLGLEAVAVVRSSPPVWLVLSCAGTSPGHVPTDLAAESLDQETTQRDGPWVAVPLAEKHVLLLRAEMTDAELSRFQSVMAQAFAMVQSQQQRTRRIRRLEKILEITHAWSQTNCMEALLLAMPRGFHALKRERHRMFPTSATANAWFPARYCSNASPYCSTKYSAQKKLF